MKQLLYAALLVTAVTLLVPFAASTAYAQEAGEGESLPETGRPVGEPLPPDEGESVEGELEDIEGELEDIEKEVEKIEIKLHRREKGKTIAGEDFTVEEGEVIDGDIELTGGDLTINGVVNGDASVVGGDLYIYGTVNGDAVNVGGCIYLKEGAILNGDAVTIGGCTYIDDGTTFTGKEVTIGDDIDIDLPGPIFKGFEFAENPMFERILDAVKEVFFFLFLLFVGLLITVFMTRQTDNISEHMMQEFPRSSLLGLALLVASPIVIVVLCVTIIGIPVAFLYGFALMLLGILAFVIFSKIIGGKLVGASAPPMLQVFIGLVLLRSLNLIGKLVAIIPVDLVTQIGEVISKVGGFVFLTAAVLGAGAVLYSRFGGWVLLKTPCLIVFYIFINTYIGCNFFTKANAFLYRK